MEKNEKIVICAESAGYCFGVERAVNEIEKQIARKKKGERICTLGKLIHNDRVVSDLEKRGVFVTSDEELSALAEQSGEDCPVTVILRTHGVTLETEKKLEELAEKYPYFRFIDCTCPFVKKIHRIAAEKTDENSVLIVLGDASHPEVRGTVSRSPAKVYVAENAESLAKIEDYGKRTILCAQTTFDLGEWHKSEKYFKKAFTYSEIFDTICCTTETRQNEAEKLAKASDLMLVIGGSESSNTAKLFAVSKRNQPNTCLIADASELPPDRIAKAVRIGITAGASTPGYIIEEVKNKMSEIKEGAESFAELFAESEQNQKKLHKGAIVSGVITSIFNNEIHVDLSSKVTGILSVSDAVGASGADVNDLFKVGDEIEVSVLNVKDSDGVANLSIAPIKRQNAWKHIVEASESGEVLEAKITKIVNGGVLADIDDMQVFIPAGQTGIPKEGDLNVLARTTQKVVIIDVNEEKKRAVASIRRVLNAERRAAAEQFWAEIEVGKKYVGTVKSLTSYGAFVDLGGVDGMVHVTELSWERVKKPEDVVSVGQRLEVYVKSFDAEKKNHISLSCKTEDSNPWNIFKSQFAVGDTASVKVVSIVPFGAFAEIVPGVDGLIHISEISDKKLASPAEVLHVGDVVEAKIKAVDEEKHQIALSIRALIAPQDEEAAEEAAEASAEETENA